MWNFIGLKSIFILISVQVQLRDQKKTSQTDSEVAASLIHTQAWSVKTKKCLFGDKSYDKI
jgi:hypothetical protein